MNEQIQQLMAQYLRMKGGSPQDQARAQAMQQLQAPQGIQAGMGAQLPQGMATNPMPQVGGLGSMQSQPFPQNGIIRGR